MCSTLDRLARLSSAEQFFAALGIAFDPHVLNVHRLHILKRFNEHLRPESLTGMEDDAIEQACRNALEKAYGEFSTGPGPRTFKVFQQAHTGFVALSDIRPAR